MSDRETLAGSAAPAERNRPIDILIVDDQEMVRNSLRRLLETQAGWRVCGEAADGAEAVEKATLLRPRFVLMDVSMPVLDGAEATRNIRREVPESEVIMVSQSDPKLLHRLAAETGARGCVSKLQLSRDLLPTMRQMLSAGTGESMRAGAAAGRPEAVPQQQAADDDRGPADAGQATSYLAAIVASSDDAIISKNLDGIITSWNKSAERLFQYSAEEAIGRHITLIIPRERYVEEADILARLRRGERFDHFQTVRMRKDGSLLDLSVTISPVRDPEGRVIGASKVARDITEQKRAIQALRNSEARLAGEAAALAKLSEWSLRLWRSTTLQQGLDEMLTAAIELLGASKGTVQLLDQRDATLILTAQRGFKPDFADALPRVSAQDAYASAIAWRERERCLIENVESDARAAAFRALALANGYRAVVCTPLIGADDAFVGVISTHFASPHRASEQDLRRLDLYLRQAVDFIQRCRTDDALRESEERLRKLSESLDAQVRSRTAELERRNAEVVHQSEQLRDLSWRVLRAQDDERRHIARELHDSAGQILTVLGMDAAQLLQRAEKLAPGLCGDVKPIQDGIQQLHEEIRTTSYLLHPPLLDESGLNSALAWYVDGLAQRSSLDIRLDVPRELGRLPHDLELAIFRLVQECLANIHRHSGSKTARIHVARHEQDVFVSIEDEGAGIAADRLAEISGRGAGVGLRGIRERLRQFHGSMDIESDSSGTRVRALIPIEPSAA